METFADYLLGEQDLINKMDILNKLQRMLREKRGVSIFFNNTVIFKTEIARMFLEYTDVGKEVDSNLVLTACLLCNCKKIDGPQSLESLHSYAKKGAEFLSTLGFDNRFCKICEEVNRYSGSEPREPESDILELVDNFGGMMLDRPERAGFTPEKAIMQLELETFKAHKNRYFEQFKEFVTMMQRSIMNMSGKVGAVKMQPLYALKRVAEEYSMSTVIGGGILKRFETIINEKVKEVKTQEQVVEEVSDNKAMFGEDVLKDLLGDEIKNKSNNNVEKQNISNVKDENETYIIEEEEEILR